MSKLITYKEATEYFVAAGFKATGIYPYVANNECKVIKDGTTYIDEDKFIKSISNGPRWGGSRGKKKNVPRDTSKKNLDSIIIGSLDTSVRSILAGIANKENTTVQALATRIVNSYISNRIREHMINLDLGDV